MDIKMQFNIFTYALLVKLLLIFEFQSALCLKTSERYLGDRLKLSRADSPREECALGCIGCSCFLETGTNWGIMCTNYTISVQNIPECLRSDVTYISIHGGNIDQINGGEFDNATNLETLEVENNVITNFDIGYIGGFTKLKSLSFTKNAIGTDVAESPWGNTNLETLDLSKNKYELISDNNMQALQNLKLLDLSDNLIHSLGEYSLYGLTSLETLLMSNNKISTIPKYSVQSLSNVRKITLHENDLATIEAEAFDILVNLQELDLSENMLTDLPPQLFQKCQSLKSLDLSDNQFSKIPNEAINAPQLQTLNFDQNSLQTLETDALSGMINLEEIKLSLSDSLLEIKEKAFYNLNQLETINITGNPNLATIHVEAFHSSTLGSLKNLYLSNNGLKKLAQQWFMDKYNLDKAEVHDNPLHCNCAAQWIRAAMNDETLTWMESWRQGDKSVQCVTPANLAGIDVFKLRVDDLTCNLPRVVMHNEQFDNGNILTMTAILEYGLPTTQWQTPGGQLIIPTSPHRKHVKEGSLEATEELFSNFSVKAKLVISNFDDSYQGKYFLTATNAGGSINVTFDITPDVPNYPHSLPGGTIAGIVIGCVVATVAIVALTVYVCTRKKPGYTDIEYPSI